MIAAARARRPQPMPQRERLVAGAFGIAFPAALTATSAAAPHAGIYALALVGQVAVRLAEATLGDRLMYGTPPREVLQLAAWGYRIDVILTPVAYMVASAAVQQPIAIAGILPLFWLLRTFSR